MRKLYPKGILILCAALVLLTAAGITTAYLFRKAEADNPLTGAVVSCQVQEVLDKTLYTGGGQHIGTEKSEIRIQNTGNTEAYLRIRLVSYWVNAQGEPIGMASRLPAVSPSAEQWAAGSDGCTYYYRTPVAPGDLTEILCDPITLAAVTLEDGTVGYQVLELLTEAIQADPSRAVTEAWGVKLEQSVIVTVS